MHEEGRQQARLNELPCSWEREEQKERAEVHSLDEHIEVYEKNERVETDAKVSSALRPYPRLWLMVAAGDYLWVLIPERPLLKTLWIHTYYSICKILEEKSREESESSSHLEICVKININSLPIK